eukprot:6589432-Ditylum_brightwellii.AAC.1
MPEKNIDQRAKRIVNLFDSDTSLLTKDENPVGFKELECKAGATIYQTIYKQYYTHSGALNNVVEEACSSKLYSMILLCTGDGLTLNFIRPGIV